MYSIAAEDKKGKLIISITGSIDSSNAPEAEEEIKKILAEIPHESVTIDMDDLTYISSAGLRVMLKVKKAEQSMKIVNVSSEVYEIFQMTGFTEIIDVEKAFRKFSVADCEVIGEGAKGTVYRYNDDTIIKVYKGNNCLPAIQRERELARKAFVLGIPTAISYDVVRVGDRYGSVFELLDSKSVSEMISAEPERKDYYIQVYAELLRQIHSTEVNPSDMPDAKVTVNKWAEACVPFLTEEQNAKIRALIDEVPDVNTMLHFDYHTNNLMIQNGEVLLIDMDTLCHGHPIFELANIYITYVGFGEVDPKIVEKFLGLPYDTAVEIWNKFLPDYLGGAERVEEVGNKAKLLSYLRHLRHVARRGITEKEKKTVELCVSKIGEYLDIVDTLVF